MNATIDYDAVAKGWIASVLNADERVGLRFGLLPQDKYLLLRDTVFTRLAELALQGTPYAAEVTPCPEIIKKSFRDDVEHRLVSAIYANGNLVV